MSRWHKALGAMTAGALAITGCGRASGSPDAGFDASDTINAPPLIDVSGRAANYPPAEAWMTDAGVALPSLEGLAVRVEEPFRLALGDGEGVLGQATLGADGEFIIRGVNTALITRGIALGVIDLRDAGASSVIPSGTVIFDVELHMSRPDADITAATAWAIPLEYHDQLTSALTRARIRDLTASTAGSLIEAGFMLGQIVDVQGYPVGGARIETNPPSWADRFFYPSEDLRQVTQTETHANGLFLFVHTGGIIDPFTFRVKDRAEYGWWSGGVGRGNALVFTIHPGETPPP